MNKTQIFALVISLLLLTVIPISGIADFGDFSGNSDYGSSWSSSGSDWGSSSWSSSSSSNWGSSSWSDNSYSSSSWSGSSSSYHSSSNDDETSIYIGLFIVVILIVIFSSRRRSGGYTGNTHNSASTIPQGAQRTPDSKLKPINTYTSVDPQFSQSALSNRLSNLYVQMQNGWTNKDISALKPYFTDALFTQYERQLSRYRETSRTNYVDNISVLDCNLRGWYVQDGYDHIIVELRTRIIDYTLDDKTGAVLSGSRNAEKFMTYEWDLSRKSGIKTESADSVRTINCPNCGAPLSINTSAHCPYCDSVVTVDHFDWAINGIKGIMQRTVSK